MLKNFSKFSKYTKIKPIEIIKLYNQLNTSFFSEQTKIQVLKTYLQIIPPHQIHNLIENKQKKLQNLLKDAQQLNMKMEALLRQKQKISIQNQQNQFEKQVKVDSTQIISFQQKYNKVFKEIYKYIKTKSPYVPTSTLSQVIKAVANKQDFFQENKQIELLKRKTYLKIMREFKYKTESLPLEQVVNFIYKLAKLNINQYEVMKAAQNSIIEETIKINYPFIRKILWAFTHLDVGSSVLYGHICKTLKVGQYELQPLQLAQSAYMLSKVNQNARGGYGIYEIAQKQVQVNLSRMKFDQLVKASNYMLTQNIGTNQFQLKLEAQLEKKYPTKDKLQLTEFVILLKSTSAYYFKFKDKALFNLLKTSTEREAKNSTLEQFQDILWSWGRLGKGDAGLWECLQNQIKRRISYLKPRQISFFYNAVCSSTHVKEEVLSILQQKFLSLPQQSMNEHYLIKMLLGMQRLKQYNKQSFIKISEIICKKINSLSKNQLLSFFKVLSESQYDYTNKKQIQNIIQALNQAGNKQLIKTSYKLKISEVVEVLYTYIKFQIDNAELISQCFMSLGNVINIPKTSFIKALFCFTIRDHYEKAYQMVVILQELIQYGPIGYFFSPYEFPLMAYSVLHLYYNSKGQLQMSQQLIQQIKETLYQINPVILNDFIKKGYDQAIKLIQANQQHEKVQNNQNKRNKKPKKST